jgi:hypothetical protein
LTKFLTNWEKKLLEKLFKMLKKTVGQTTGKPFKKLDGQASTHERQKPRNTIAKSTK